MPRIVLATLMLASLSLVLMVSVSTACLMAGETSATGASSGDGPDVAALALLLKPVENEHPLMPALRWARGGLPRIERIQDYRCTLIKRERVGGRLSEPQHLFLKVRRQPFSVYVYFLTPEKGQEVIYPS